MPLLWWNKQRLWLWWNKQPLCISVNNNNNNNNNNSDFIITIFIIIIISIINIVIIIIIIIITTDRTVFILCYNSQREDNYSQMAMLWYILNDFQSLAMYS